MGSGLCAGGGSGHRHLPKMVLACNLWSRDRGRNRNEVAMMESFLMGVCGFCAALAAFTIGFFFKDMMK